MKLAILVVATAVSFAASDTDWSRFRGPNGTGISNTSGLPAEFGPDKNVVWKTTVPSGHSSPVLTDTRIFMTGAEGQKLFVLALDRATGKELWRQEVPRRNSERLENVNGPASPSPVTDGERVFAFFQSFGLIGFTADGKELWRMPLGPFNMFYGFGASPILVDGTLILPVDQDTGSYLLGVDPRVVPVVGVRRQGRPSRVVGARARLRDEVGGLDRRGHRVDQRLGVPAEPAGHAGPDDSVRRRTQGLRQE
jgi:hypothetical protein